MLGAEALRMAFASLWSHKLRSIMTIIGVVVGISAVIAVVSLGAAFEQSITSQFDEIDDRSIFVTCGSEGPQNGPPDCGQYGLVFTEVDRQALLRMDGVERVIVSGQVPVTNLRHDDQDVQFQSLSATTSDADEVRISPGQEGKYLSGGPFKDGADEMVLGYNVAQQLSGVKGRVPPTIQAGDQVTLSMPDGTEHDVTVAGVLAEETTLFGSKNSQVFVPVDPFYTTQRTSPTTGDSVRVYLGFTVVAGRDADITAVQDTVDAYMQQDSDAATLLRDLDEYRIYVATASDITQQIGAAFDQITVFIAGIAGVSLVVGGIMIATIMLITVTERTKEIGVMKAIGGRDSDVLAMFLFESAIVGLAGSILGIALGLGVGAVLIRFIFSGADLSFVVPWTWIGISVLFGMGTGVLAGLLPAVRATRIRPVEALSYE